MASRDIQRSPFLVLGDHSATVAIKVLDAYRKRHPTGVAPFVLAALRAWRVQWYKECLRRAGSDYLCTCRGQSALNYVKNYGHDHP